MNFTKAAHCVVFVTRDAQTLVLSLAHLAASNTRGQAIHWAALVLVDRVLLELGQAGFVEDGHGPVEATRKAFSDVRSI